MASFGRQFEKYLWGFLAIVQLTVLSTRGELTPRFTNIRFLTEPEDVVAIPRETAVLNCRVSVSGGHQPTITWLRDRVVLNLNTDPRRTLLSNGSLLFNPVVHTRSNKPDEGSYRCKVEVPHLGSVLSRAAKLQVAYIERFFEEDPRALSVRMGGTAMFGCMIESLPTSTIRWYRNGVVVDDDTDDDITLHPDGVLEVSKVSTADYGQYKCCATLPPVQTRPKCSSEATLSRDVSKHSGAPSFVMRPVDSRALIGSTIILYCAANGGDSADESPTITWLRNGATLSTGVFERHSIVGQGSLRISDIRESDTAESDTALYTCRASNSEDSVDADATLQVIVPPRIVNKPENVYGQINGEVEFRCEIYGYPKPIIHWRKDGNLLVPNTYFQISDNMLRIMGLVSSDDGMYQCIGENAWGNVQAYAQLKMLNDSDGDAASIGLPTQPLNLNMPIISTRFATIHWDMPVNPGVVSVLTYSVLWKEYNSPRERVQNTTTSQFTLQHLTPGTRYLVKVYAHNSVGRSNNAVTMSFVTKQEAEVPSVVRNNLAMTLSSTEIRVEWQEPREKNGDISKYMIYFYEEGQPQEQHVETPALSYVFTSLKSFKTYAFRIMAYNNNGAGPSTDEFHAMTYSSSPSASPSNVSLQVTSSKSVLVSWDQPPVDDRNGIITGYQIRYKRRQNRRASRVITDANIRTFDLKELDPNTMYSVKVAAQNVNGTGVFTPWMYATTHDSDLAENRVPGQPSSLATRALVNSIVVSWTPPNDPTIRIRGYTLNWGIGHPHGNTIQIEPTKRFYTIEHLQPSTNYVISLNAYNDVGAGQPRLENTHSRSVTATPEPKTPMFPPVYLKAIVVSDTSVTVTWIDNSLGVQQIVNDNRHYTVRYSQRNGRKHKYYNTTNLNAHIENLRPSTMYEFSVKVIKGRRQSVWSMTAENATFESAPQSAPRDVTPIPLSPTTIQLSWQPPRNPNGLITGYLIYYTTDNSLNLHDWVVEATLGESMNKVIHPLTPDTTYYFKMQARNNKGLSPFSPTVIFRTPRADFSGGGTIPTPDNPVYDPKDASNTAADGEGQNGEEGGEGGISSNTLWIIIAVVAGCLVIAIIVFVGVMCRRRYSLDNSKNRPARNGGYKPNGKNNVGKAGPKDINPPDLWIHHEQMELKGVEKPNHPDQTMTVAPMRRDSQEEMKPLRDEDPMQMDKRRNSFLTDSAYSSHSSQDDDRYSRRHRSKPIMIPVDSQPLQPIATATAIPNGHILSDIPQSRPPYPRTQFTSSNLYSSTPRVQGGENSLPSSGPQSPTDENHCGSPVSTLGSDKGQRPVHPLKSFSVPGPPSGSVPTTPTPKHIVKPQPPLLSPYRKNTQSPAAPTASGSAVAHKPPLPVVMPKAPDVTIRGKEDMEIQRATSTEELNAEMANLEGLMKDLNAITQSEFEC